MSEDAPTYVIEDPHPRAASSPYTFLLPSDDAINALEVGDLAKLIFRATAHGGEWDAERMWVIIDNIGPTGASGVLDSQPSDMPGVSLGDRVNFDPAFAISVLFSDAAKWDRLPPVTRREYWDQCLVDSCVLEGEAAVEFLYREAPLPPKDDGKPVDSGWRIRASTRGVSDEDLDARTFSFVALGAVLNRDDSWLHLIDEPEGAAFERDLETQKFVRVTD